MTAAASDPLEPTIALFPASSVLPRLSLPDKWTSVVANANSPCCGRITSTLMLGVSRRGASAVQCSTIQYYAVFVKMYCLKGPVPIHSSYPAGRQGRLPVSSLHAVWFQPKLWLVGGSLSPPGIHTPTLGYPLRKGCGRGLMMTPKKAEGTF